MCCLSVQRTGDVTFICAIHYGDTVVWDQKRRLIKHMLNLREKERGVGGEGEHEGDMEGGRVTAFMLSTVMAAHPEVSSA